MHAGRFSKWQAREQDSETVVLGVHVHVDGLARCRAPTLLSLRIHAQHGGARESTRGTDREAVRPRQHARLDKPTVAAERLSFALGRTQPTRLVGNRARVKRGDGPGGQRRHGARERAGEEPCRDELLMNRSGGSMEGSRKFLACLIGNGQDARGAGRFVAIGVVDEHLALAASASRHNDKRPRLQRRKPCLNALQLDEVVDGIVGDQIVGIGVEEIGGIRDDLGGPLVGHLNALAGRQRHNLKAGVVPELPVDGHADSIGRAVAENVAEAVARGGECHGVTVRRGSDIGRFRAQGQTDCRPRCGVSSTSTSGVP